MEDRNIHSPYNDRALTIRSAAFSGQAIITLTNTTLDRSEVMFLDKQSAQELYAALTEVFGDITPPPVTFQSQFAELAVGDHFTASTGIKGVKIDDTRYYNYDYKIIKHASLVGESFRLTKEG